MATTSPFGSVAVIAAVFVADVRLDFSLNVENQLASADPGLIANLVPRARYTSYAPGPNETIERCWTTA